MSVTMAVFRRAISLSTAVLLTAFLEVSIGRDITTATLRDTDCYCYQDQYTCTVDYDVPCPGIMCSYIDSPSEVECAQQFLNQTMTSHPREPLWLVIENSNLDLFPDDFCASYNVVSFELYDCDLTEIPMRLINPVCDTIIKLDFRENKLRHIPEGTFSNCTRLQYLYLNENDIENLSPKVFYGLNELSVIYLDNNRLTSFNGLEGIPELITIFLSTNSINYLDKNAFQNMRKLNYVDLRYNNITTLEEGTFDPLEYWSVSIDLTGNPLYCNCSLKWLQDLCVMCFEHDNFCIITAYCSQDQIDIKNIDMNNCTSASTSTPVSTSTEDDSPGRATRSSMTDLAVLICLLMFALTYFRVF